MADEEDVAICAFTAFLRGVEAGRFSQLEDRNDLWRILVMLTERRAFDQIRAELTTKRGGGHVRGDSALFCTSESGDAEGFDQLAAAEPTPAFAVQASEQLQRLLRQLKNDELQRVAIAKMEGYTNIEIAEQLGKSVSSIERKLSLIRDIWGETNES
jgi:DNA-directed RNA polymerase specialized sigma24 family protein